MSSTDQTIHLTPEVRAAISTFLNECQRGGQFFEVSKALDAVRRVFPDLDISDADLADAIASEALTAGLDIHYDTDNPVQPQRDETERKRNNETVGKRRRAKETEARHRLV